MTRHRTTTELRGMIRAALSMRSEPATTHWLATTLGETTERTRQQCRQLVVDGQLLHFHDRGASCWRLR